MVHADLQCRVRRPTTHSGISRRSLFSFDFPRPGDVGMRWLRVHRRAMACRVEVALAEYDNRHVDAARAALDEADRVEALLTVFRQSSELSRVNREAAGGAVVADAELFTVLQRCARLYADTDGAFDVTSTPLSRCWGFLQREGRVPTTTEIEQARARVGMRHVVLDEAKASVRFDAAAIEINLGAFGKGYAVDRMGRLLRAHGVRHALVSAGGSSVLAVGGRRRGWPVDISSPIVADRQHEHGDGGPRRDAGARRTLARVHLRDAALGTSGAGEQFIMVAGVRFGHVIDPRTGWPTRGVLSATVVTRDAADADALSTAFLIGGEELARRYCDSHPGTLALLMPDDGGDLRVIGSAAGVIMETIR